MSEVEKAVETVMTAFEEFKAANDARLSEIEKKGSADVLTEEKVDRINARIDQVGEPINQRLTLAESKQKALDETIGGFDTAIKSLLGRVDGIEVAVKRHAGSTNEDKAKAAETDTAYVGAFGEYLRKAEHTSQPVLAKLMERKALISANDTLGGYYVAPPQMERTILKAVVEQTPLRALCQQTTIGVSRLQIPKRTGVFAATRVGEQTARSESSGYTTGMVEIRADEMFAKYLISVQAIEDSAFDLENEIGNEFAEQFAVKEGQEFLTGIGTSYQCEGILVNGSVESVKTGLATDISSDSLLDLFYSLKTFYTANARWGMHRLTIAKIRKLKTGEGDYIWQPGLANGIPNTINGAPYVEFPDMPQVGAGTYPVVFGDFRRAYRIVDRVGLGVQRDPFTQADNGQIVFRARSRVGGAVQLPEAIKKLLVSA